MKKYFIWVLLLGLACGNHTLLDKGTIKAGNLQIYYERTGKGEPLLLIHAGMQDHTMWSAQVKELSKYYTSHPTCPIMERARGSIPTYKSLM